MQLTTTSIGKLQTGACTQLGSDVFVSIGWREEEMGSILLEPVVRGRQLYRYRERLSVVCGRQAKAKQNLVVFAFEFL